MMNRRTGALATLVALLLGLAPAGSALSQPAEGGDEPTPPTDEWSIVPTPNAGASHTSNAFAAVECVASSDCWAVGSYLTDTGYRSLTARWDGTAWDLVPSPNVPGARYTVLSGLTCVSFSECWAVGFSATGLSAATYRTLVLRWDGTSWGIVPSPNGTPDSTNQLSGVACASPSDCWAVGYHQPSVGSFIRNLVLHWDGASWSVVPSPNADLDLHNSLAAVTCVGGSDCWAVGSSSAGSSGTSVTMRWDGDGWAIVPAPRVEDAKTQPLSGVTCVSSSDCWAVGLFLPDNEANENPNPPNWLTLTMHWDGASWAIVESPNGSPTLRNGLSAVTCVSSTDCVAAGFTQEEATIGAPGSGSLMLAWDGTSWEVVPTPAGIPQSNFRSVTCVSPSDCWVVGGYSPGQSPQSLAERWDGTAWSVVPSPNHGAPRNNVLSGVACVSATDCWAAGWFDDEGVDQTLVLRWDGRWWRTEASPNVGPSRDNVLSGVTCVSTSDCWAVGHHEAGVARPLILRWDGAAWRRLDPPAILAANSRLTGVTCSSSTRCWAVGHAEDAQGVRPLILRWDGTVWELDSPAGLSGRLAGVACASSAHCWAVGTAGAVGSEQALVLRLDGTTWSMVPSPGDAEPTVLNAVACSSPSDCWAVGRVGGTGAERALLLRWDGSVWQTAPSPTTTAASLNAVACVSTSVCRAVGTGGPAGAERTLILRWDGSEWSAAPSPNTVPGQANILEGIACATPSDCRAVGSHRIGSVTQTLSLSTSERPDVSVRLTYHGPTSVVRGADVTLSARLNTGSGEPLAGRPVRFSLAGAASEAVTDHHGVARVGLSVDRSYGTHELVVSFGGDPESGLDPGQRTIPFTVRWGYRFVDGTREVRVNTITGELQFVAPGDVTEAKPDPGMSSQTLPSGETLISIDYSDEDLTVVGEFIPERGAFAATVSTENGPYVLAGVP